MKRINTLLLVCVVGSSLAGVRAAEPQPGDALTVDFTAVDTDKDGMVSTKEVQNIDDLRESFLVLDINRDERLTPTEFSRWVRAGKIKDALPSDPSTAPSGSAGSQHMPRN